MSGVMKKDLIKAAMENRKNQPRKPSKAALKALHGKTRKGIDKLLKDK